MTFSSSVRLLNSPGRCCKSHACNFSESAGFFRAVLNFFRTISCRSENTFQACVYLSVWKDYCTNLECDRLCNHTHYVRRVSVHIFFFALRADLRYFSFPASGLFVDTRGLRPKQDGTLWAASKQPRSPNSCGAAGLGAARERERERERDTAK